MSKIQEIYGPTCKALVAIEEARRDLIQAINKHPQDSRDLLEGINRVQDAETLGRLANAYEALERAEAEFERLFNFAASEMKKVWAQRTRA